MISKCAGLVEPQILLTHNLGGGIPNWPSLPPRSADAEAAFTRFINTSGRERASPFIMAIGDCSETYLWQTESYCTINNAECPAHIRPAF